MDIKNMELNFHDKDTKTKLNPVNDDKNELPFQFEFEVPVQNSKSSQFNVLDFCKPQSSEVNTLEARNINNIKVVNMKEESRRSSERFNQNLGLIDTTNTKIHKVTDKVNHWVTCLPFRRLNGDLWVNECYSGIAYPGDEPEYFDCLDYLDIIEFQARKITRYVIENYSKENENEHENNNMRGTEGSDQMIEGYNEFYGNLANNDDFDEFSEYYEFPEDVYSSEFYK